MSIIEQHEAVQAPKRKTDRIIGAVAGSLLTLAAVVGYNKVTDAPSEQAAPAPTATVSDISKLAANILLIGDQPCPEGGEVVTQSQVVQDYVSSGPESDLLAIRPAFAYDVSGVDVFCGPDYGANGERFDGNAIVAVGNSTIIDLD
jgi:hypothetical protein